MGVIIIDKSKEFKAKNILALDKTLLLMGVDIRRLSADQVPHDKGTLRNTGARMPQRLGLLNYEIRYGEAPPSDAPYARRWEFETSPHGFKKGKKSRYLRDSAEKVIRKSDNYFRKAFETIRI